MYNTDSMAAVEVLNISELPYRILQFVTEDFPANRNTLAKAARVNSPWFVWATRT